MDKSWMVRPRSSDEFLDGLESFLDFAFSHTGTSFGKILCPCVSCANHKWKVRDDVRSDVVWKGMIKGYNQWVCHGEDFIARDATLSSPTDSLLEDNHSLSKEAKAKSNQAKENRKQQTEVYTLGRKSIAQKENEMEIVQGGPVGAIELYRETHKSKNYKTNPTSTNILEECESCKKQRISPGVDVIELDNEIVREVRETEHSGRVRGVGRGPTPSSFFDSKRRGMPNDFRRLLEAQLVAERAKMEAQMEAQLVVERAKMEAQLLAEQLKHDKIEAHLNRLEEKFDLYLSR